MNSYPNERDCEHGQLRRSCAICVAERESQKLHEALCTIAEGREYRSGAPKMDGTIEWHPHLIDRKRMMEIAREALGEG